MLFSTLRRQVYQLYTIQSLSWSVKVKGGEIIDRFESFANPHQPLSATIIELTGITDDMLTDAPEVDEVFKSLRNGWATIHLLPITRALIWALLT